MKNPLKQYGAFGYNWWYLIRHPWEIPIGCWYDIKHFCQRGWRGYANCDAWSIDYYLNKWMPSAVRSLKGGHGTPITVICDLFGEVTEPTDEQCTKAHALWQEILEKIALGFEAGYLLEEEIPPYQSPRELDLKAKKKEGMDLFLKYYDNLWD